MTIAVDIQRVAVDSEAPADSEIDGWARAVVQRFRADAALTVRIVDLREGTDLNERFRQRSGPTNVLSFPVSGLDEIAPELLGDIVICAPVVVNEAAAQCKSLQAHWAHLVVHGALHLLGFDHQDEVEAEEMEEQEREVLASLGYADPYAGGPES